MALDPKKLSVSEIKKTIKSLEAELERRSSEAQEQFLAQVRAQAEELGIPVAEVVKALRGAGRRGGGKRTKVKAKYANPADASQTWSGRGRKPRWVVAHLDGGGAVEDLAI